MIHNIEGYAVDVTKTEEKVTLSLNGYSFTTPAGDDTDKMYKEILWQLRNMNCIYFSDEVGLSELELRDNEPSTLLYIGSTERYPTRKDTCVFAILKERNAFLI